VDVVQLRRAELPDVLRCVVFCCFLPVEENAEEEVEEIALFIKLPIQTQNREPAGENFLAIKWDELENCLFLDFYDFEERFEDF
jgi:hypothetical protein